MTFTVRLHLDTSATPPMRELAQQIEAIGSVAGEGLDFHPQDGAPSDISVSIKLRGALREFESLSRLGHRFIVQRKSRTQGFELITSDQGVLVQGNANTVVQEFEQFVHRRMRVSRTPALLWRHESERLAGQIELLHAEKQELLESIHELRRRNEELYRQVIDGFKDIDALHGLGRAVHAEASKEDGGDPATALLYVKVVEARTEILVKYLLPPLLAAGLTGLGAHLVAVHDRVSPARDGCVNAVIVQQGSPPPTR